MNRDMDRKLKGLKGWIEEREDRMRMIIEVDFKAWTREEEEWSEEKEQKGIGRNRKSKEGIRNQRK